MRELDCKDTQSDAFKLGEKHGMKTCMKLIEVEERDPSKPLDISLAKKIFCFHNTPRKSLAGLWGHCWIFFESGWFAETDF